MSLVPVGSTGPHVIVGNEIILPSGGTQVELEAKVIGLQEDSAVCVWEYQFRIDSAGFSTGLSGSLTPARIVCDSDDDCFGKAICDQGICDVRAAAYIDQGRRDYLFYGLPVFLAFDFSTLDFGYAAAMLDIGICNRRDRGHLGTLILDVSADATGTYTVGFLGGRETFVVVGFYRSIFPCTLTPARITIHGVTSTAFAIWPSCVTGPSIASTEEQCEGLDIDHDADVDLQDFANIQVLFTDLQTP